MKFSGSLPGLKIIRPEDCSEIQGIKHDKIIIDELPKKKFDNGHWEFPEQMGGKEYSGFLYAIFDTVLERGYIGKKTYWGAGKLNSGVESNWRKYATSSGTVTAMLKVRPKEEFEFICLEQYKKKGALAYAETWSLCLVEAPTSKIWYNTRIEAVSWNVTENITQRHKARLDYVMRRVKKGN